MSEEFLNFRNVFGKNSKFVEEAAAALRGYKLDCIVEDSPDAKFHELVLSTLELSTVIGIEVANHYKGSQIIELCSGLAIPTLAYFTIQNADSNQANVYDTDMLAMIVGFALSAGLNLNINYHTKSYEQCIPTSDSFIIADKPVNMGQGIIDIACVAKCPIAILPSGAEHDDILGEYRERFQSYNYSSEEILLDRYVRSQNDVLLIGKP